MELQQRLYFQIFDLLQFCNKWYILQILLNQTPENGVEALTLFLFFNFFYPTK